MVNAGLNEEQAQALSGLTILDLGQYISAPLTAKLLGGFGAEVIKVETPISGDPSRRTGPFLNDEPHPERSALFLYMNTNKKGITLNLKTKSGQNILKNLVKDSDVLLENFVPGYLSGLGIDYETLSNINPGLVMASITDFGQTGPYKDFKGGRLVDNALSGYMFVNGEPEREPLASGGDQPSYQGGLYAYAGVMASLLHRGTSGQGQHLDVAHTECMVHIHQFNINRYEYSKMIQQRVGNKYSYAHPLTIYPCKDGYVSVTVANEDQCERLLLMIEMVELMADERFETGFHRLVNSDEFDELVIPWFLERGKKEIVEMGQEWRVPISYVNNCKDMLEDEQFQAREFFRELDHPEAGPLPYAAAPFELLGTPVKPGRAPLLGEHNQDIFCGKLGMSSEDMDRLKQDGII